MGRRSLAERIYEELDEDVQKDGTWIVLYDFKETRPGTKFWDNLKRVVALTGEGSLVQYSVYMTRSGRGARAAARLVKHYGGETLVFHGEVLDP
ncbi:MAG TPA: hypothetical protein VGB32_05455 [Candidatus Bathyarchaeia archaeon]